MTLAAKKDKILRNKLKQGVKNLYTTNYKTLLKETKKDTNKWKGICLHRPEY